MNPLAISAVLYTLTLRVWSWRQFWVRGMNTNSVSQSVKDEGSLALQRGQYHKVAVENGHAVDAGHLF